MAAVPSIQCFRLEHLKFLLQDKNVIEVKLFLRSLIWKFLVDFKASKLSQLGQFFSTVRLRKVILALWTSKWVSASANERLEMQSFRRGIAGTAVWCPLTRDVRQRRFDCTYKPLPTLGLN